MLRPSRSHVARERLTSALRQERVGVIEAAGGFGKSSLAREYRDALGIASVEIVLRPTDLPGLGLPSLIVSALRRANLSDLAVRTAAVAGDLAAWPEVLSDALRTERHPVLLVFDDVHHADATTAGLLVHLVRDLPAPHRALVLGRALTGPMRELRRAPTTVLLDSSDLLFSGTEVADLVTAAHGLDLDHDALEAILRVTDGWPAAVVLTAALVARARDRGEADPAVTLVRSPTLTALVHESLAELPESARDALIQLAHLPWLSADIASAVGPPDLLPLAAAAGFPLAPLRDGTWAMPGPVQEDLARRGRLRPDVAARAAGAFIARADVITGCEVLLSAGMPEEAARVLGDLPPQRFDHVDYVELRAIVDVLPETALDAHPRLLLHLARACEVVADFHLRAEALGRARASPALATDPALGRELEVERARDLARDQLPDDAEPIVRGVLAELPSDEGLIRARALDVLGRCAAARYTPASLAEAERHLETALRLCRQHGAEAWASQIALPLAFSVRFALGRFDAAIRTLDEALAALPARSRHRAVMLTFRADIQVTAGRFADAAPDIAEAHRLSVLLGDHRAIAYAAWEAARNASYRMQRSEVVEALREAERHRGDWFEHATGAEFLADAADLLDRVGETRAAEEYLDRAAARAHESPVTFAISAAAVRIRSGTTAQAVEAAKGLDPMPEIEPRDHWRVHLLRAAAARRAGDGAAGPLAAAAFGSAASLGVPRLPLLRERAIAEPLARLAAASGSRAAASLVADQPPVRVTILGGFRVELDGRSLPVPTGRPGEALRYLAAAGGRVRTDELIEALWPEIEPELGRQRLRNVLARIRDAVGPIVVREADVVAFAPEVEIDALAFERQAREVLGLARVRAPEAASLARATAGAYRGGVLPDDPYASWAVEPRERLARLHLRVLDILVAEAERAGEVDEAVRVLERAIEEEPDDEDRYLRAARLLLGQGRRGQAQEFLRRARGRLEALGVPAPSSVRELERALRA